MLLVLTGAFGFTLVMAGLVIVYSKASAAMGIVEYLLLLFSGAVVRRCCRRAWSGSASSCRPPWPPLLLGYLVMRRHGINMRY